MKDDDLICRRCYTSSAVLKLMGHRATAGVCLWSGTKLSEYDLCRKNKQQFADAVILMSISLIFLSVPVSKQDD